MTTAVLVVCVTVAVVQSVTLIVLALSHRDDRDHWHAKESELLNRIWPETAQPLPNQPVEELPVPLPTDDDDAWHDAIKAVSDGRVA